MAIELYDHQLKALSMLKNGSILCGGVGSGKSRTALAYFYTKVCEGLLEINGSGHTTGLAKPRDLYIITTARKRDTKEWEQEIIPFVIDVNGKSTFNDVKVVIDSWNNIGKYASVIGSFFIFDEQRVVGKGAWVKAFLQIAKKNKWILLSATPGDTWMDYIPMFIANGFYKNRTEFIRRHVVFSRFSKYPKVDHYVEVGRLIKLRQLILVNMRYVKSTSQHHEDIFVEFDKERYDKAFKERWNEYEERPVKDISELCFLLRKISNSSMSRIEKITELIKTHPRTIIFYNFDYELEILRKVCKDQGIIFAEWNGHKHQVLPKGDEWVYLVQYAAGAEGWNCTETNTIIFFSQSYSYKATVQAAGRIDRINTPYSDLYYYYLKSRSSIDLAISKTIKNKKDFNERSFIQ